MEIQYQYIGLDVYKKFCMAVMIDVGGKVLERIYRANLERRGGGKLYYWRITKLGSRYLRGTFCEAAPKKVHL